MNSSPSSRNHAIDNLRAFLIICVVAGHLLEFLPFRYSRTLYVILYSFHMPAFAFVSGWCCKFDSRTSLRLLRTVVYRYVLFQTLYLLFAKKVLHDQIQYQYTTPYWLLWYLISLLTWTGMLGLVSGIRYKSTVFLASLIVSILSGFDTSIGYYASLSRTLTLFPFFLGGHYVSLMHLNDSTMQEKERSSLGFKRIIACCAVLILTGLLWKYSGRISNQMIYHSMPYSADYTPLDRTVMMGVAWVWIASLLILAPRFRIPWLTYCGQNTAPIYLFHGFIMKYLAQLLPRLQLSSHISLFDISLFAILTLLIPLLLSSKPFTKLANPFLKCKFIF